MGCSWPQDMFIQNKLLAGSGTGSKDARQVPRGVQLSPVFSMILAGSAARARAEPDKSQRGCSRPQARSLSMECQADKVASRARQVANGVQSQPQDDGHNRVTSNSRYSQPVLPACPPPSQLLRKGCEIKGDRGLVGPVAFSDLVVANQVWATTGMLEPSSHSFPPHTHTHSRSHLHTHIHAPTLAYTHSRILTLAHTHSRTYTWHTHIHAPTLAYTHSRILTLAHTHSRTYTWHTHIHACSHLHTHSHMLTHINTPTYTQHTCPHSYPPSCLTAAGPHTCRTAEPDLSAGLLYICSLVALAGELGRLPSTHELVDSGVQAFNSSEDTPTSGAHAVLDKLQPPEQESSTSRQWISVGVGLPALPQKVIDRIRANEYIDFTELPPAKGKSSHWRGK